jgi:hypothetical protein
MRDFALFDWDGTSAGAAGLLSSGLFRRGIFLVPIESILKVQAAFCAARLTFKLGIGPEHGPL